MLSRRKFIALLALTAGLICLGIFQVSQNRLGNHPEFGKIYSGTAATFHEKPFPKVSRFLNTNLPANMQRSRFFPRWLRPRPKFLSLGNSELEWEHGGANGGWIYFRHTSMQTPLYWEFAQSRKNDLLGITSADIPEQFFDAASPELQDAFSGAWNTRGDWKAGMIFLDKGETVFARRKDQEGTVFVIQFLRRESEQSGLFHYCIYHLATESGE